MAKIRELGSREARKEWRKILDTVMSGDSDVLISRHGQEIAVLIPASDYFAILEDLEELRLGRMAEVLYQSYLEGTTSAKPYEDIRDQILEE
ncbi:MAG: type II toxin-antitoxin system Phd/YefM family antitoxin [Anaerolineales bacterium]|jgi:prevent-host-death family protein